MLTRAHKHIHTCTHTHTHTHIHMSHPRIHTGTHRYTQIHTRSYTHALFFTLVMLHETVTPEESPDVSNKLSDNAVVRPKIQ